MTKIKNQGAYPLKIPVATDTIVGNDSENDGKTVSFQFDSFVDFINSLNGSEIISYIFATSPVPDLDENGNGFFLSENNIVLPEDITELKFSKKTKSGIDISDFLNFVDSHKNTFTIQLRNLSDPNNFLYLNVLEITEEEFQFTFSVSVYASDVYIGELINKSVYVLEFNIKADTDVLGKKLDGLDTSIPGPITMDSTVLTAFGSLQKQSTDLFNSISNIITSVNSKLDKSTYVGSAQTLKDDIDNIYQPNSLISSTVPTRVTNTFTFPALGYEAIINKVRYKNASAFVTTINSASTDFKRVDLIYIGVNGVMGKVQGVENANIAPRPDLPVNTVAISFINVFGPNIEAPTPITPEISFQDQLGVEKFRGDFVRFENVSFDITTKKITIDPVVAFTVFVDTVLGDDSTGVLGNINKPFKSDLGAYGKLPANDGTTWTLQFIDKIVTRVMGMFPARPLIIKSNTVGGIFSFSTATGDNSLSSYIQLDIPGHDFVFNNLVTPTKMGATGGTFILNCRNITLNVNVLGTAGFFIGIENQTLSSIICNNFTASNSAQMIGFSGTLNVRDVLTLPNTGSLLGNGADLFTITARVVNHAGTGTYAIFGGNGTSGNVNVRSITGAGTIEFVTNYARTMFYDFTGTNIASTITLSLGSNPIANRAVTTVTGIMNRAAKPLVIPAGKALTFSNFEGNVAPFSCQYIDLKIFNSTIYVASNLINGTAISSIEMSGTVTIIQTTASPLILNQATMYTINIYGDVKTNSTAFGVNINQNIIATTFKEKRKEVVVRDKIDLVGRVLDSQITYIIDGIITLLTGEYIEVPLGGLTITGYGFDVSQINKNVSGQSIFTSPAGNSGNFVTKDMTYNPGIGSVFNITDSNGTHAIELNDVNFQGVTGSSLGTFTGYRQFTGTTCGFYSLSDGIILEGNWSGFKLTNSNVIGFGASGTLFKKGTATVFSNRFYIDLNIQVSTGSKICDFADTNFTNDKSLQVVNCYTKVNGVINDGTTGSTFPNITPYSAKSYFVNNIGIKNSNNMPYGISTTNLQVYANDAAAASGGIVQVGETYIETSTGYFKKRLT
ncbi:MAG: hypothetical protein V4666_08180 [Bacteroidota bacterium]